MNLHHRIGYSLVLCILHSWFQLAIVFFSLFFFISPLLSLFSGKCMESLYSIIVLQAQSWEENKSDRKRGMILLMWDSLSEEQWIPLWCFDETFQNSKWEYLTFFLISFADTCRMCKNCYCWHDWQFPGLSFLVNLQLLINIFPGLSSKLFLLPFDIFLISKLKEIKEPDVV